MSHIIKDMIETRTSVSKFKSHIINQTEIEEMIRLATLAPSAYNFQNWKFIAVTSDEGKQILSDAAYGQPQVISASVTFIICGQLNAHRQLADSLRSSVNENIIPADIAQSWVEAANSTHESDKGLQRDEAIRSASLAAMTLIYAAKSMGYESGIMGGFDASKVAQCFHLNADDVPVMLVPVGKADEGNWPQKIRKPVSDVIRYA